MPYKDKEKQKQAQHESYLRNKKQVRERTKTQREAIRQHVRDLKTNTPCADCDQQYHYCAMQFDHLSDDKVETVARLASTNGWKKVKEEIVKCEIVCSNCHHIRTFNRMLARLSQSVEEADSKSV